MILLIGLILSCFLLEIGAYPVIPDTILDYRWTKEFIALATALIIFLKAVYFNEKIECKNKFLLVLIGYIVLHPFLSPSYNLTMFGMNIAGFWELKPITYALVYFLFFCVVSNWSDEDFGTDFFVKTLYWISLISSFYILIQYQHLDQWQRIKQTATALSTTSGDLTATFTHPNYAGSIIALGFLIACWRMKFVAALVMGTAIILINSKMVIASTVLGSLYLFFQKNRVMTTVLAFIFIYIGILILCFHAPGWEDNGRFLLWAHVWHDTVHPWINEKTYFLTGYGLGFFRTVWFHMNGDINGGMTEVHNEPLQWLFEAGFIGFMLLIFSVFYLLKRLNPFTIKDNDTVILYGLFFTLVLNSLGLFIGQIEPHRLIFVTVFALLHGKIINHKGEANEKVS